MEQDCERNSWHVELLEQLNRRPTQIETRRYQRTRVRLFGRAKDAERLERAHAPLGSEPRKRLDLARAFYFVAPQRALAEAEAAARLTPDDERVRRTLEILRWANGLLPLDEAPELDGAEPLGFLAEPPAQLPPAVEHAAPVFADDGAATNAAIEWATVGDLDASGHPVVIAGHFDQVKRLGYLDGAAVWIDYGAMPRGISGGVGVDLNEDRALDLVGYGTQGIRLGFGRIATLDDGGLRDREAATGAVAMDVDADGDLDVLSLPSGRFLRNDHRPILRLVPLELPAEAITSAAAGDLDGDGRSDLLVRDTRGLAALLNRDTFQRRDIDCGDGAPQLAEVDGDGHLDLLVERTVCFGDGAGSFRAPVALPFSGPYVVADFDVDGRADIAGTGEVRFGGGQRQPLAVRGRAVGAADLTGNGMADLVVLKEDGGLHVLRNTLPPPPGSFQLIAYGTVDPLGSAGCPIAVATSRLTLHTRYPGVPIRLPAPAKQNVAGLRLTTPHGPATWRPIHSGGTWRVTQRFDRSGGLPQLFVHHAEADVRWATNLMARCRPDLTSGDLDLSDGADRLVLRRDQLPEAAEALRLTITVPGGLLELTGLEARWVNARDGHFLDAGARWGAPMPPLAPLRWVRDISDVERAQDVGENERSSSLSARDGRWLSSMFVVDDQDGPLYHRHPGLAAPHGISVRFPKGQVAPGLWFEGYQEPPSPSSVATAANTLNAYLRDLYLQQAPTPGTFVEAGRAQLPAGAQRGSYIELPEVIDDELGRAGDLRIASSFPFHYELLRVAARDDSEVETRPAPIRELRLRYHGFPDREKEGPALAYHQRTPPTRNQARRPLSPYGKTAPTALEPGGSALRLSAGDALDLKLDAPAPGAGWLVLDLQGRFLSDDPNSPLRRAVEGGRAITPEPPYTRRPLPLADAPLPPLARGAEAGGKRPREALP